MKTKLPTTGEELAQAAIKGAVSAIPFVGGLFSELGTCLVSPFEKRKREWAEEVEAALEELSSKHNRLPAALSEDPMFVTALLKATGVALATHQQAKRAALRVFLVAVGSRAIPNDELQHALLRLLEDLSVGHLEVLRFLHTNNNAISACETMDQIFERYGSAGGQLDRMAFRWILADLSSRMVIHIGDIEDLSEYASQQTMLVNEGSKVRPLQITDLGQELLRLLIQTMPIHHSKEEHEALHRGLLANPDDVTLFTNGGCAVFAIALHREFGYPIHYVPGYEGSSISHVFCLLMADGEFAVDVIGTKHASARTRDFGSDCAPPISLAVLESKFCALGEKGFLGESWFVDPAMARALARIQKYRPYFNGTRKELIPNVPIA